MLSTGYGDGSFESPVGAKHCHAARVASRVDKHTVAGDKHTDGPGPHTPNHALLKTHTLELSKHFPKHFQKTILAPNFFNLS